MHYALLAGSAASKIWSCGIAHSGEAVVVGYAVALEPNTTLHANPNLLLNKHLRTNLRFCMVKVDAQGTQLQLHTKSTATACMHLALSAVHIAELLMLMVCLPAAQLFRIALVLLCM